MAAKKTGVKNAEKITAAKKKSALKTYDTMLSLFKARRAGTLPRGLKFSVDGARSLITFSVKSEVVASFGLVSWSEFVTVNSAYFKQAK